MASKMQVSQSVLDQIDYPSRFPLKVFGNQSVEFEQLIVELVKRRCPSDEQIDVSTRPSRSGKYLALTLTFTVYSREQLEKIYQDLYECEDVVMSL